jgi:spore coat protein H
MFDTQPARSVCWLLLAVLWWPVALSAEDAPASQPGDNLFRPDRLVQLHLRLSEEQFAALKPTNRGRFGGFGFGGRGGAEPAPNREQPPAEPRDAHRNTFGVEFPWSEGKLEVDGETFKKVGVRWKGNYTYMVAGQGLKRPLKIDINRHKEQQRLDGLTMLNLHTNATDPTRTREAFAFGVFRDAGVPAPRTAFAELRWTVPGQYEAELAGLYTLTEQVNARFLKRHFGDGSGLLLKPENLQGGPSYFGDTWSDYAALYHPQNEGTADEKLRLMEFCWLVSVGTDEEFAQEIGGFLDVDAFLKFIALNALLSNMDSYLGFGHNYYLYLVPGKNHFVFIPWDLDLSLATWPAVGTPEQLVDLSLQHPHAGDNRLIDRLLAIPQNKDRYLALIREQLTGVFTREKLEARLAEIEKQIAEPLAREQDALSKRPVPPPGEGRGGGAGGGFGGRGGFGPGGGQYGQSLPPRLFVERRLESIEAQLAGQREGFQPRPFGMGFGRPRGQGGPPGPGGPTRQGSPN